MKFAIQENMLPGDSFEARFAAAKAAGADGVEVWSNSLGMHLEEIAEASIKTGVPIAAIYHQQAQSILDQDAGVRESALAALRDTICCAADLGASGVIVMPGDGTTGIADLSPYMTAYELYTGLFYTHMRTLEDFSLALGVLFYIQPVNRYETRLIRRVNQAADILRRLHDNPSVKIAPDTFHMSLEEVSIPEAITAHAGKIGCMHVADSNRRLPGQGVTDFAAVGRALQAIQYDGWATLACGQPNNPQFVPHYDYSAADLAAGLDHLRQCGW